LRRFWGLQLPFAYFARPDPFSVVTRALGPIFVFCAPELIFDVTEGIKSRFHDLRAQTRFQWYRGCLVPFSCFTRPDSFSAVPRASRSVLMCCAPGLVFGCTEDVGSHFHVLRAQTHFQRYRGRWVPFSRFALPDSVSAVSRALGPVLMFCAPELVFGGTGGFRSRFHVLQA
jgi:hypothetical protein